MAGTRMKHENKDEELRNGGQALDRDREDADGVGTRGMKREDRMR